jgi:hypothetical protein
MAAATPRGASEAEPQKELVALIHDTVYVAGVLHTVTGLSRVMVLDESQLGGLTLATSAMAVSQSYAPGLLKRMVLYADAPGASCTTSGRPLSVARFPTIPPEALSARLKTDGGPSTKQASLPVFVKVISE